MLGKELQAAPLSWVGGLPPPAPAPFIALKLLTQTHAGAGTSVAQWSQQGVLHRPHSMSICTITTLMF